MKKTILATALLILTSTPVLAETVDATIQDHFKTVTRNVPSTEQICNTVEVPIYGSVKGQASTGDALVGAIIGGAIGNQVGNGSGKDAATVLGAIIGADVANKRGTRQEVITGYRQETRCNNVTTYSRHTEEVYSHSTIRFKQNGRWMTVQFQR